MTTTTEPATVTQIDELQELQAQLQALIRAETRLVNQANAIIRRALGWRWEMPEAERGRINKTAQTIRKHVEKHFALPAEYTELGGLESFIESLRQAREPVEHLRAEIIKRMESIVAETPLAGWVDSIPGLGRAGVAMILGETGDPANYPTVQHIGKRLGLAVIDGERQRKCSDPEKAAAHGYNPRRRSIVWQVVDSLLRRTDNDYYPRYVEWKAEELEKPDVKTKMHAHNRARRKVAKLLVKHLWYEWANASFCGAQPQAE